MESPEQTEEEEEENKTKRPLERKGQQSTMSPAWFDTTNITN